MAAVAATAAAGAVCDVEADAKTEIAHFSGGVWSILKSSQNYSYGSPQFIGWGSAGSTIAYGDFDGDGKMDPAYIVPEGGGQSRSYAILKSSASYSYGQPLFVGAGWSSLGDTPVVGDFDGDGKADPSIWRASQSAPNGLWILQKSSINYGASFVSWGQYGDTPIVADFDGDGKSDVGYYRNGTWGILKSSQGYALGSAQFFSWGGASLAPIVADFDGDGRADIAYITPPSGGQSSAYAILLSSRNYSFAQNQPLFVAAGWPDLGDTPVVGDWDGDGKADPGIWRASTGVWMIPLSSSNYAGYLFSQWGQSGNVPLPSRLNEYMVPRAQQMISSTLTGAEVDPINRTGLPGEDLFSGNYNWSLPILGLAGRAGLDLGLSLTYNSLVWTRYASSIAFDSDRGFPAPGFRLGFPTIQQQTFASQSGAAAFLMIGSSGSRVELRQVTANLYESPDSSWLQLDTSASPFVLRTADGSQLSFQLLNGEYRCTKAKDRNGNYITISYDGSGRITTIIDTLARTATFVYSGNNLQKITQLWNNAEHIWALFEYTALTIQTSFSGLSAVGPQNGTSINVLSRVTLDDLSAFEFEYTSYGQVKKINHKAADSHLLASTAYDMSTSAGQTDCPRFTKRTDYAENWMTVDTNFSFDLGTGFGQVTAPDGTLVKEYHGSSGFTKGLTTRTETFSIDNLSTPKKTTIATWTQDNEALAYPLNPRVVETNITDDAPNTRRVTIGFSSLTLPSGAVCKLPADVREFAGDGTTVLRKTHTDYLAATAYLNQHIIGLRSASYLYDSDGPAATPVSKVTYGYDDSASLSSQGEPVQHDSSYGTSFLTRGNPTSVTRWDVTTLNDPTPQSVTSTMSYNTTGNLISSRDALQHQVVIVYADSFAATGTPHSGSTLGYPTTVTDPDGYSSTTQYDYDLGVPKITTDPKGATLTRTFDSAGRVTRIDSNSGGYTKFVFPWSMTEVDSYVLQTASPLVEIFSTRFMDGAGRVIRSLGTLPGSTGGYTGQKFVYDLMGRPIQQSNPTEINSSWTPSGDDAVAGWLFSSQTYDWKGRPRIARNTDTTTRSITYGGCGCAGGEVVTIQDEVGRQQRMTYDVLGRLFKTESLNTDANHSVYATRTDTYNARDQVTRVYVQQGTTGAGQETLMSYDGHGRLQTRKTPIEFSATGYTYFADDSVQKVTDPRGATSTFSYNARHLVSGIAYCKPGCGSGATDEITAIPDVPPVAFGYDSAGNRTLMTDGLGRVDYVYNIWSQMTSETRSFTDFPSSSFPVTYDYNLAGQLKTLTDPFGASVNYAYNQAGQLSAVTGSNFAGVTQYASNIQYRAWGAMKHDATGDGKNTDFSYNDRLQVTSFARGPNTFGHSTYEYHADGRVSFVHNLDNAQFDRKYSYDHVGRLREGLSGTDARGETYDSDNPPPYKQTYTYDVFDNMNGRTNRYWTLQENPFAATYTNDRNTAWVYDDAGNVKNNPGGSYDWDTAGRMRRFNDTFLNQYYDGDGLPALRIENRLNLQDRKTIYYVRSSLLGGQPITELNAQGAKRRTYVYARGQDIARQESAGSNYVVWITRDPITGDDDITRDPLGGYLGNPNDVLFPDYETLKGDAPTHDTEADPFDSGSGCTLDGMPINCSTFASMVNNGAVSVQVGGKILGAVSHVGFGGFWVRQWTPSQPSSADPDPTGPLSLNVTDNAYSDVWVPFAGADKRQGRSASPGPRRLAGVLKELFEFLAGLLPGHSEQCSRGLMTARQNRTSVNEANKFAGTLRQAAASHGIDWRVLAAVSIRETGFQNIDQQGGPGRAGGYFQIDFNAHPNISREQAFDINWAADWTAGQFASDIATYEDTGFTSELSLAGAIRNHNAGPRYTLKKLKRDQRRGGFANLNAGTWHSNYVTNILDLMDCFAP